MAYKSKADQKQWFINNKERIKTYQQQYRIGNKDKLKQLQRLRNVKSLYNLDAEEYLKMIVNQNNSCAICFNPESLTNKNGDTRPLCVDHCHKTGKVRGLLCNSCNAMLGNARDDKIRLLQAIHYLDVFGE